MSDSAGDSTGPVPLEKLDGDKPGTLAPGALGIGLTCVYRSPADKRVEAEKIVNSFQEGKINDLEMFAKLRDLLGKDFVEDVLNRLGSMAYYGLNLDKVIVERPSLKDQYERIENTMKFIVDKAKLKR